MRRTRRLNVVWNVLLIIVYVATGGSCGTQPFNHYSKNETYTSAKCRMECSVDNLVDACGCRDAYMPGERPLCNLTQYVNCVRQWNELATSNKSSCSGTCINHCEVVSFFPGLSSSQLTYIDGAESDATIVGQFNASLEMAERTDDAEMIRTVELLTTVNATFGMLKKHIDLIIVNGATSVTKVLTKLIAKMQASIKATTSTYVPIINKWQSIYLTDVQFIAESLAKRVGNKADLLLEIQLFCAEIIVLGKLASTEQIAQLNLMRGEISDLIQMRNRFNFLFGKKDLGHRAVDGFPWNLLSYSSCSLVNVTFVNHADSMTQLLDKFILNDIAYNDATYNKLMTDTNAMYESMITYSKCLLQYKVELDSLANWVNTTIESLSVFSDTSSMQPSISLLNDFNRNGSALIVLCENYASGIATKLQLANNFTDTESVGGIVDSSNSLISDIQTAVFDALETIITDQQSSIVGTYMSKLKKFTSLRNYMSSTDHTIEKLMRRLDIWRQPYVSLQEENLFAYTLTADETWSVWPVGVGLQTFTSTPSLAPTVLNNIVKNFMDEARSYYKEARSTIVADQERLQAAVQELQSYFTTFKVKIKKGVTSDTFIKLDIYYGELKSQKINQEKAYDLATFFSDFGGLFGLFLGGSAMSLFEIVDLIIYNAIVKLTTRRRVQPAERHSEHGQRLSLTQSERNMTKADTHVINVQSLELDDSVTTDI